MLTGHRYRVLIYFAALVLCLSVCFAFAEPPASIDRVDVAASHAPAATPLTSSMHLLYYTTPGRSTFMPPLTLASTSPKLVAAVFVQEPFASADRTLKLLDAHSDHANRFTRNLFPSRRRPKLVKMHAAEPLSASAAPQQTSMPDAE